MKRLGVFLLPPGWDAGPSQGYAQHKICRYTRQCWARSREEHTNLEAVHHASRTCVALIRWFQLSLLIVDVYLCWLVGFLAVSSCYLDNVSKETAIWCNANFARGRINTQYSAGAGRNIYMLFTGREVRMGKKLCPRSWVRPSACGLGPYSRPRAQFFPMRTNLAR